MDAAQNRGRLLRHFRAVIDAPRWLLLVALIFAPWAYGCTRPWGIQALCWLLDGMILLWAIECLLRERRPQIPPLLLAALLCLLVQGWWMTWNAKSIFNPDLLAFIPKPSFLSSRPGSVDAKLSTSSMWLVTSLAGALLFTVDLAQRPIWRKRILLTMAFTGLSIGLFGIAQKIGGEPVLSWTWEPAKLEPDNNFALYRYRGNAGAYLNILLPIIGCFTLQAFHNRTHSSQAVRAFWAAALLINIAAIQLNPSRASCLIAILLGVAIVLLGCWRWFNFSDFDARDFWKCAALSSAGIAALALICFFGNWQSAWKRIGLDGLNIASRSPTEIYLAMLPDAGVLGFGPGTFRAAFPGYQLTYDFGQRTVPEFWTKHSWLQAHNDYLQTIIEWGYLGAVMWVIVFAGGLARAALRVKGPKGQRSRDDLKSSLGPDSFVLGCVVLAISGTLLHGVIDFPLQIASIQLYIAVLLGLCWHKPSSPSVRPIRPQLIGNAVMAGTSLNRNLNP